MKKIITTLSIFIFLVNGLFGQVDTLFGIYRGVILAGSLNLKPDSTFEYLNGIDVGAQIKTRGNYHKIGDEIIFKYNTNIYPEIFEVKDSFNSKINKITVKIVVFDSTYQSVPNNTIRNKILFLYQHKSDLHSNDTSLLKRLDNNGIGHINDLQADSIIVLPALCTPIIYRRIDKSKNYYEFKIRIPSPKTIYCLTYEKLFFDKGFIYFNSNKKGNFWYNSTLYKSRKSQKKINEMFESEMDYNKKQQVIK